MAVTTITSATTSTPKPATGTAAAGNTAATGAGAKLAGDMQTFLKMLTTQLQNQDPTKPLDPNEFTAQLAQFASVEQEIAVNQHLDSLIALQRSSIMLSAAPLVGHSVEVTSSTLALRDGKAQELRLPAADGNARTARIIITNASGQTVRDALVGLGAAASGWNWDGRGASGLTMPDGTYKVAVTGIDAAGTARGALDFALGGTVTGIARKGDVATLSLGALGVGLDSLRSVAD
jgi:flagellar basal-body rod modification protein FlgD